MERHNTNISRRSRRLRQGHRGSGPVVYWMSRDQRIDDNWALLWAQQEAITRQKSLLIVFCLVTDYPGATPAHFQFMLTGINDLPKRLAPLNIGWTMLQGPPEKSLPAFLHQIDAHAFVCDFDPLRIKQQWKQKLISNLNLPFYEVDAHNIIPAWTISEKKEYAAYTIRPKIKRLLADFLTDFPPLVRHPINLTTTLAEITAQDLATPAKLQASQKMIMEPGEREATRAAKQFIDQRLVHYGEYSNNPCRQGQSGLSPYLHFGQLSAQRLAIMVSQAPLGSEEKEHFLEELIVRRELSDNFCLYEPAYDSVEGFPQWAQKTLDEHRGDTREYLYTLSDFEAGNTHEALWNACQLDLVQNGKLHGFLRMYWSKKILEWTPDPETALAFAITLNDRYSLDGRDPNGYTGIAWSIGGVHDRAWKERPVFGKIRYMNQAGCRRKFDVEAYITSVKENTSK
ncbi:deoxyribodipyrimidine photo-lyase [Desulforhopalus sp. IMCC35007]|uniref:deoxyribodipyrimidine photo-lyase n=1 Tax=Desulforhopalus sp. IMCC35007 TaxID=2569543 RepID=UPI0010AE11AD|nr:deoxyribodipyrimidine photo-lyase [Desulforhopalus sp. IMCC35007]TKB07270.1 deoxyribodipyrimidine photo-lyase [Desulforhopalus sp. IMCC35007]